MKTSRLLVAAILLAAIGAPISGFFADMKGQPVTSAELKLPFLHGYSPGPSAAGTELASLDRATEWLNSPPLTPLDLHLHQLAAHAALSARLGRQIP